MDFLVVLILVSAIFGIILITENIRARKRREALQAMALRYGYTFTAKPVGYQPYPGFQFRLFNQGRAKQQWNALSKTLSDGTQITLFDYQYTTGSGKSRTTHYQTVFAAQGPDLALPTFRIDPEIGWVHGLGKVFGLQDINFERYPKFSKLYLLRGDDEAQIRAYFHGGILQWFEQHPGYCAEGQSRLQYNSSCLLLWQERHRVKPEALPEFALLGQDLWYRVRGL